MNMNESFCHENKQAHLYTTQTSFIVNTATEGYIINNAAV